MSQVIDEYIVDAHDFEGSVVAYDEDSYCVAADSPLEDFHGLDFEWLRKAATENGWTLSLIPF